MKLPTAVLKLVYYSSGSPLLKMNLPRRGFVSFPSRAVYTNLRTALAADSADRVPIAVGVLGK